MVISDGAERLAVGHDQEYTGQKGVGEVLFFYARDILLDSFRDEPFKTY